MSLVVVAAALATPAGAAQLDGSLFLSTGTTDNDGQTSDILDQQANLVLRQQLTDYVTVRLGYRYFDFTSDTGTTEATRRTVEPRVELVYSHPDVFGSLSFADRSITGQAQGGDLDVQSLVGNLTWRVREELTLTARYRDESNVLDAAVFGIGTDTRFVDLEAGWQERSWGAAYSFETWDADNRRTGLGLTRESHELRLDGGRTFLGGRLWLGLNTWGRLSDQRQTGTAVVLGDPVPLQAALFAVDPSPETGELAVLPGLADGDTVTPTEPRVDIGGASTFRNVGVDLGVTRPISQLEISVDVPSEPGLVWQVFRSRDNLLWEPVAGVSSEWDGSLLLYRVRFPSTEDRFFKAVNVSVNGQPRVAVTEVRALRDVAAGTVADGETTFYRADGTARFQPHQRITGSVNLGITQDEGLAGSVLRRDFRDVHGGVALAVELPAHLTWSTSYRYSDFEDRVEPVLLRTEELASTQLAWSPLPTVDAVLVYQQREENDEDALVRDTTTTRFTLRTELLPELELDSTVEQSDVVDPFLGEDRTVFSWRERLEARVFPNLLVGGGYSYLRYEDDAGVVLLDRSSFDLRMSWRAGAYLTLTGDWSYDQDQFRDSVRQSYAVAYTPGPKLTVNAAYQEFTDEGLRETSTSSASLNYRVNDRFRLFGNYTRSETVIEDLDASDVDSFRLGLAVIF